MPSIDNPRLCGGTFFALLLEAKIEAMSQREHWQGHKDERIIPNLMSKLLWVMSGSEQKLAGKALETFGSNVNKYRLCKIASGAHVPLKKNGQEVRAFDKMVRENYETVLKRMDMFIEEFLDLREEVEKDKNLVKALLETVSKDETCTDASFYVNEDGSSVTRDDLIAMKNICFPAFVLGMWHYALMGPDSNTEGKDTIDAWCPSTGGGHREYTGTMGQDWPEISLHGCGTATYEDESSDEPILEDKRSEDENVDTASQAESNNGGTAQQTLNQTQQIINPFTFIQNGDNNTQIGYIQNQTINKQ